MSKYSYVSIQPSSIRLERVVIVITRLLSIEGIVSCCFFLTPLIEVDGSVMFENTMDLLHTCLMFGKTVDLVHTCLMFGILWI